MHSIDVGPLPSEENFFTSSEHETSIEPRPTEHRRPADMIIVPVHRTKNTEDEDVAQWHLTWTCLVSEKVSKHAYNL